MDLVKRQKQQELTKRKRTAEVISHVYEDSKLLSCPITKDIFIEPVVASDGFRYEKYAIQNVLRSRTPLSPITREPLSRTLYPNKSIESMIDEFRKASKEFQDEYNTSYDNYETQTTSQTTFMFTNETLKAAIQKYCHPSTKQATIEKYGHIQDWNVTHVTDMTKLFENKERFNEDISTWDVSNVTNMDHVFLHACSFNQPLNNWNVSNVTTMKGMFYDASSFNQPLNEWNVSNVTHMKDMFLRASSFNQSLDDWDVSKVENMEAYVL